MDSSRKEIGFKSIKYYTEEVQTSKFLVTEKR
jgi:hypothetical protein